MSHTQQQREEEEPHLKAPCDWAAVLGQCHRPPEEEDERVFACHGDEEGARPVAAVEEEG